jgi:hypothetical protein
LGTQLGARRRAMEGGVEKMRKGIDGVLLEVYLIACNEDSREEGPWEKRAERRQGRDHCQR